MYYKKNLPIAVVLIILLTPSFCKATLAQSIYELVMQQKPASLSEIEFNTGRLFSIGWEEIKFEVYKSPDTTSTLLLEKRGTTLFKHGVPWCEFEAGIKRNCYSYLSSSDSNDLPIVHSIEFSDIKEEGHKRMWYRITLDGIKGWVPTPYNYSSSEPYISAARNYMLSNPYVRWLPTDPTDTLLADVGRQSNRPLKTALTQSRRLQVKDGIRWVGNTPVLEVCIVEKLDEFTWCTQTKLPKTLACGVMYMFLPDKRLSIYQMGDIQCD